MNAAGCRLHALGHFRIAVAGGADLPEQGAEDRHQRQALFAEAVDVEVQSDVTDAVGRLIEPVNRTFFDQGLAVADRRLGRRDVAELQRRQAGEILFRFLGFAQFPGLSTDFLDPVGVEFGTDFFEAGGDFPILVGLQTVIGAQGQGDPMGIVEQIAANQLLKIGAFGDLSPQLDKQLVEAQGLDRIAAMNPGADQAHQQHQGVGILVPGDFADGKLQTMENSLDPFGGEAGTGRFFEGGEDQRFDLGAFFGVDPLQTGGEIGGAVVVLVAAPRGQIAA